MIKLQRIIIAGEGGQGVQLIAKVLTVAAQLQGFNSLYIANYGVEQRGGVSLGFVQITEGEIGFPKFQYADILVVLIERAVKRTAEYLKSGTVVITDRDLVKASQFEKKGIELLEIPASKIAKENLIPKVFNTIILGCLGQILQIDSKNLKQALEMDLIEKYKVKPELKHFNERALEIGMRSISTEEGSIG